MLKQVPDQIKISYKHFYALCKNLKSGEISEKKILLLQSATDIDYIGEVVRHGTEEDRIFLANFIAEWYALTSEDRTKESTARVRSQQRDVFTKFHQLDTQKAYASKNSLDDVDSADFHSIAAQLTESVSDFNSYTSDKTPKEKPGRYGYSIDDYMPSKMFNIDALINMIDIQKRSK